MLGDETEIASGDTKPNEIRVSKFVHGQVDKSGDLLIILEAVYKREESASGFVVSLLSRWHKARYLEEQGEVILYCEESFLVYFHIIELFSNYYIKEQKKEVEDQIKKFIKELSSTTLKLRDKRLEQFSEEKFKVIYPILIPNGQVPITSKICYFLDRVELLNIKTHYFIKQVVDIRNDIAHGRPVNYKTLNWPLPSFFSISGNVENFIFYIRTFTARVIGAYLSIEAWIDEWDVAYSRLDMPPEYVKKLINNDSFKSITPSDFLKGINGIKPSSLVKQFLLNKINIKEMEIGLKSFMLDVVVDKESASEIFEAAIVLADSSDERLSDRCRSIVIDIHKNKLVSYFSRENVPRNIEQQGCKLSWFREWKKTGSNLS